MIDMEFVRKNKAIIVFYLLLVISTLVIVQSNKRGLETEKENVYVYLKG